MSGGRLGRNERSGRVAKIGFNHTRFSVMKIAIACSGLGHITRGIETWAEDLGTALHRQGEDVTIFKGGGIASRPFERVVCCAQRKSRVARFLAAIGKRFFWRYGFGYPTQWSKLPLPIL